MLAKVSLTIRVVFSRDVNLLVLQIQLIISY